MDQPRPSPIEHARALAARLRQLTARPLAAAPLALALAGCIVVPRTAEVYDPQCRTYVKQVVLETTVIASIGGCHNDGCAVMLATLGVVSAASAVVSGSVAVIGNIVYWAERKGQCPADAPLADRPPLARIPESR